MVDGFSTFRKNPRAKTLEWDPDCGDISFGGEIDTNCFIDPSDSSDSDPTGNARGTVRVGLSKGGIIAVAVVVPVVVIAAVVLACFLCGRRKRRPFGAVSAAGAETGPTPGAMPCSGGL